MSSLLLLGLGREAKSTWRFIQSQSDVSKTIAEQLDATNQVWLADEIDLNALDPFWQNLITTQQVAGYIQVGTHQTPEQNQFDVIVRSPGVPLKKINQIYSLSAKKLTSNTQLFFDWLQRREQSQEKLSHITTIGVTGTKGKSTTTAMIHAALTAAVGDQHTFLGGNMGTPPLNLIEEIEATELATEFAGPLYVSLELSCHQLADLTVSPNIAVIQNITPEHLDYYDTVEEYAQAKSSIARYQKPGDTVFYFEESKFAKQIAQMSAGDMKAFSLKTLAELESKTGQILIRDWKSNTPESLLVVGSHNIINALPALLVAQRLDLDVVDAAQAVRQFTGLPYRLQYVVTQDDIAFYNDSLATTPEAAAAAIASFPKGSVVLLAGGHDRHVSFEPLAQAVIEYAVPAIILFPPTGSRIQKTIEDLIASEHASHSIQYIPVETMPAAIDNAFEVAQALKEKDSTETAKPVVLLSPAAPSFGTFKDYQDRGDQFIRSAQDLHFK